MTRRANVRYACGHAALFRYLAMIAAISASAEASAGYLLSIAVDAIDSRQYITDFHFWFRGLRILAVSHVPADWTMEVSDSHDDRAYMAGAAHHGASRVSEEQIGELGQDQVRWEPASRCRDWPP
jgi:hypothetical protein